VSHQQTLEAIYAKIPALACQRKCQECCGPISMTVLEYVRIFDKPPAPRIFFQGYPTIVNPVTGDCLKLGRDGSCLVYPRRPAICRLFGVVRAMACPFGCEPERWLSDNEANAILTAVEELSRAQAGPPEPKEPQDLNPGGVPC
jgi:Fe-S-cluster containining protein